MSPRLLQSGSVHSPHTPWSTGARVWARHARPPARETSGLLSPLLSIRTEVRQILPVPSGFAFRSLRTLLAPTQIELPVIAVNRLGGRRALGHGETGIPDDHVTLLVGHARFPDILRNQRRNDKWPKHFHAVASDKLHGKAALPVMLHREIIEAQAVQSVRAVLPIDAVQPFFARQALQPITAVPARVAFAAFGSLFADERSEERR